MDESKYQLGIRQLTPHQMVTMIIAYRNALKDCQKLCKAFAQENFAQDVMHKVMCAYKEAELDTLITDYEYVLRKAAE